MTISDEIKTKSNYKTFGSNNLVDQTGNDPTVISKELPIESKDGNVDDTRGVAASYTVNSALIEDGSDDQEQEEDKYSGKCNFFCNLQSWGHKFIALILMCAFGFGNYFCYDNPGALQSPIMDVMNVTTFEFENLYLYYSIPNCILPIVGGFLIDRVFGIPVGTVIFAGFICLGQCITAVGAFSNSFLLMKISRIIFGIGGESLAVAGNTYAAAWFQGNALNTVMGFRLSFARVGSYVNFLVVGNIFRYLKDTLDYAGTDALGWTLVFAGISTIISLFTAMILGILERRRARIMNQGTQEQPKIQLTDVKKFSTIFWLITLICVTYYITVFPFISVAQVFLEQRFGFQKGTAEKLQGLPYLISGFLVPIFGFAIDRLGRNIAFVTVACTLTLISHIIFAFARIQSLAYLGIAVMGCGYSLLAASLWPMISLITPLHRQGTAFGITQAIQNLGLGVSASLVGKITDLFGYFWLEVFFMSSLSIAIAACIILWIIDNHQEKYLVMSIIERRGFEATPRYKTMLNMETTDAQGYTQISN